MKNKLPILSLAAFSLAALAVGCNKQENAPIATSAEVAKPNDPSPADALRAAESQKAADASKAAEELKAADAKKQAEAAAQKEADADKADQALKQVAADKRAAEQTAAERQAQLTSGADKVQSLINSAKALSGENKWADVLRLSLNLPATN